MNLTFHSWHEQKYHVTWRQSKCWPDGEAVIATEFLMHRNCTQYGLQVLFLFYAAGRF